MKLLKEIILWSLTLAVVVVSLGFVRQSHRIESCKAVNIHISGKYGNRFISKDEVTEILCNHGYEPVGKNIAEINLLEIERILSNQPSVLKAEAYITIGSSLIINIMQRTPLVRVFNLSGKSSYIDENGKLMETSGKFTARTLVATGWINESFNKIYSLPGSPAVPSGKNIIQRIFELSRYISSDPFWKSQIEQIYVNENGHFELIPLVGNHNILIGDSEDMETKFKNLKALYTQGLKQSGWKAYKEIDLRFRNQVVCRYGDTLPVLVMQQDHQTLKQ